jgi:hypothetical protein
MIRSRSLERCLPAAARQLPGGCRTQRWEGSRPRPAAAGSFPEHTAFPDQERKCTLSFGNASRRAGTRALPIRGSTTAMLTRMRGRGKAALHGLQGNNLGVRQLNL